MLFYTGTSSELKVLNEKVLEMELQRSVARARNKIEPQDLNPAYKITTHVNFMDNDLVFQHVEFENKEKYDDQVLVNYKNKKMFYMARSSLMNNLGLVVEERAESSLEEKYKQAIIEAANMLRPDYNNILVIDKTNGFSEAITRAATSAVQHKNKL